MKTIGGGRLEVIAFIILIVAFASYHGIQNIEATTSYNNTSPKEVTPLLRPPGAPVVLNYSGPANYINVSIGIENSHNSKIAQSFSNVYVVWEGEGVGNATDIYVAVSHDKGFSFGKPINLSNSTGNSSHASVGAFDQSVYVVFEDDVNGQSDVFISGSMQAGQNFRTFNLSNSTDADSIESALNVNYNDVIVSWTECSPGNEQCSSILAYNPRYW
ncbi:MAG: hypothetical protein M3239_04870 [Thermoproteota archaeon]|nr:hypothetical protein [Thermoproteota archaeon]